MDRQHPHGALGWGYQNGDYGSLLEAIILSLSDVFGVELVLFPICHRLLFKTKSQSHE
jgi:hypothetical protein